MYLWDHRNENELLALIDKFNTFVKLGNACLALSRHDGVLGLVHRRLHLFVMLILLFLSVLLKNVRFSEAYFL